jgi:hypothetical protein
MADAIIGNTQVTATKAAAIAAVVQKELKFQAKLLSFVTDVSAFCGKGMKSIAFPKLTSFTAVDRASGAAGDATVLTSSVDTLNLDISAYIAWLIDSQDEVQSTLNYSLEAAKRAASGLARFVDEKIIAQIFSEGEETATAANDITKAVILEMRQKYLKQNGDLSEAVLLISPYQETKMLLISEFSQAQIFGSSVIPSGQIGSVYGMPVVVHNGLTDYQYALVGKSGVAIGFQTAPMMSEQGANEYGASSKRVAVDQLFGVKCLEIAEAGAAAGKSALVIISNAE